MARLNFLAGGIRCGAGLMALLFGSLISIAAADTFEWTNPSTGQYNIPGNWTRTAGAGSAPPDDDDKAVFNEAGAYSVNYSASAATDELEFIAGDVTLRSIGATRTHKTTDGVLVQGGDLTLGVANAPLELLIGNQLRVRGGSRMDIMHGSQLNVTGQLRIGANASGDGELVVEGPGGSTLIGTSNSATLVGSSGSTGTLRFLQHATGVLQNDLNLAASAVAGTSGVLEVANNATLDIAGDLRMATGSGANLSATVDIDTHADVTLAGDLLIGTGTGTNQSAVFNINGLGSTFAQTGAGAITVGGGFGLGNTARLQVFRTFTSGTGQVTIAPSGVFEAGFGTQNINGPILIQPSGRLEITDGNFNANAGIDNSSFGTIQFDDGTLTLGGGTSLLTAVNDNTRDFTVSGTAPGERPKLIVRDGAVAQAIDDLNLGLGGFSGDLEVLSGGDLRNSGGILAAGTGSEASVLITGTGSLWNADVLTGNLDPRLTIGQDGTALVEVANGGKFVVSPILGENVGASGTIDVHGEGSRLEGFVGVVGGDGQGVLKIRDGATAAIGGLDVAIRSVATSSGLVEVNDGGALRVSFMKVGSSNAVSGVGARMVSIGSGSSSSGTLTVLNELAIRANGEIVVDGPSSLLSAKTINHTLGGTFRMLNDATLEVETFEGDLTLNSGNLAPGSIGTTSEVGATLVTGTYAQGFSGALQIDIGGTAPGGSHDIVTVTGTATFDGDLELSLIDSFVPEATDTFVLLEAASITGFFDNVFSNQRLDVEGGEGSFLVHYGTGSQFASNRIVLSDFLSAGLPGDFDLDEDVDGADFLAWQRTDGNPAGLSDWQMNYGTPSSAAAAATSVPEPSSFLLLLTSCLFAAYRSRR